MPTNPAAIVKAFRAMNFKVLDSVNVHLGKALVRGHKQDSDFVIVMDHVGGELVCWLLVGKSPLFGKSAMDHLAAIWCGDESLAEEFFTTMAVKMGPNLHAPDGTMFVPIRDERSEKWRAFRGEKPMSIEEVRAQAQKHSAKLPSTN